MLIQRIVHHSALRCIRMVLIICGLVLSILLSAPLAYGQTDKSTINRFITLAEGAISAKDAASIAKRRYGGKVLNVKSLGGGNYQVKLLQDSGRVMIVTVSASGRVSG